MVLSAIVCRSNSDREPKNPDAIDLWERLKKWVEYLDLSAEMEPHEREMIYAPLGSLEDKRRLRATWDVEGLAVMTWALRRFPLPKHDEEVDPYGLTDNLWFLSEDALEIIQCADLHPSEELNAYRELAYAIHCRLREYLRDESARSIAHWLEADWLRLLEVDSPLGYDEDLRIGDVAISMAKRDVVQRCEWAICERHRAIIWLIGEEGPLYSQFSVDT